MIFQSFIYKPNPKKIREDKMSLIYLAGFIILLVLLFIFFFRGVLGLGFVIFVGAGLIKLKVDEIKNKGTNRFGSLPSGFSLSPEKIIIGRDEYLIDNVSNLKIEADDFRGGPGGDIFSSSPGTDNYVEFISAGEKHSYQFLVKQRSELVLVNQMYKNIQNKNLNPVHSN